MNSKISSDFLIFGTVLAPLTLFFIIFAHKKAPEETLGSLDFTE
jgi:hypothetical protein